MVQILKIGPEEQTAFNDRLRALESHMVYPYGTDSFQIDHGKDYFAFFNRLGRVFFHAAVVGDSVVACGCGILRIFPSAGVLKRVWYLCDLKVHPNFRHRGIPGRLLRKKLFTNLLLCRRAYTISMNPASGRNKVLDVIERFPWVPFRQIGTLCFYQLTLEQVQILLPEINQVVGDEIRFIRLSGVKDIVLNSTNEAMPLFHAQYGPIASPSAMPAHADGQYMFCCSEDSVLHTTLNRHYSPSATASVLGFRINKEIFRYILSSDV